METGATDPAELPQGWFVDPCAVHEQRWLSQGSPTALARDGRAEAQDPPPDRPMPGPSKRATPTPRTGPAGADLKRADPRDRGIAADGQFDFLGNSAPPGMVGMPTTAPQVMSGMPMVTIRTDGAPLTPKPIVRSRWVALGFAGVWTLILTGLLCTATTTSGAANGHSHAQSVRSADPGGVAAFVAMLAVAGLGFVRRLRARSEAPSRPGYVFAGILGVLGLLSVATIGLASMILGTALDVVARPLIRPRPLPGERVTGP